MALLEKINQDITSAMKSKDKTTLESLRAVKTAIQVLNTQDVIKDVTEDMEIKMLQKLVKQRKETADIYISQNRQDLANIELSQALIIERYLPTQLSINELTTIIKTIVDEVNPTSIRDMGKVMSAANKQLAGKADGKTISEIVKTLITF